MLRKKMRRCLSVTLTVAMLGTMTIQAAADEQNGQGLPDTNGDVILNEVAEPAINITMSRICETFNYISASAEFREEDDVTCGLYILYGSEPDVEEDDILLEVPVSYEERDAFKVPCGGELLGGDTIYLALTVDENVYYSAPVGVEDGTAGVMRAGMNSLYIAADAETASVTTRFIPAKFDAERTGDAEVALYEFSDDIPDNLAKSRALSGIFDDMTKVGSLTASALSDLNGTVTVSLDGCAELQAGDRVAAVLKLPHPDMDGECIYAMSDSVQILSSGSEEPAAKFLLYNMGEDTCKGEIMREIAASFGAEVVDLKADDLNQQVGYLAGIKGYGRNTEPYSGHVPGIDFALFCNMTDDEVNEVLSEMSARGVYIDFKATIKRMSMGWTCSRLIANTQEEDELTKPLVRLNDLMADVKDSLDSGEIADAGDKAALVALYNETGSASYEVTTAEEVEALIEDLKALYLRAIGKEELSGELGFEYTLEEGGAYTVHLTVSGMQGSAVPEITWYGYDDEDDTLEGVPAADLAGLYVQVSADGFYGTISATPEFPETPVLKTGSTASSVTASWDRITGDAVSPAPYTITATLLKGGEVVAEEELSGDATSVTFKGLAASTEYHMKVCARSIVGRSDKASAIVRTGSEGGNGSGRSSGGGAIKTPDKQENGENAGTVADPKDPAGEPANGTGAAEEVPAGSGDLNSGAKVFADVSDGAWYGEAVSYVTEKGYFAGTSDSTFEPDKPMTRGMFVKVLANMEKADCGAYTGNAFPDLAAGSWYGREADWAASTGLITGMDDGNFGGDLTVTREQIAVLMYRYALNMGMVTEEDADLSGFADAGSVSDYAGKAMSWAVNKGIIKGSDGRLEPERPASRAEVAQIIMNFEK